MARRFMYKHAHPESLDIGDRIRLDIPAYHGSIGTISDIKNDGQIDILWPDGTHTYIPPWGRHLVRSTWLED